MEAKCEHCDKVYIRKDSLMRHKKTRHGVSPTMMTDKSTMTTKMPIPEKMTSSVEERKIKKKKKRFSCWICRRTYGNLSSLDRHRRISCAHKGMTRNVVGEMVYSCGSCAKEYKYRKTLLTHQQLTGHNNTNDSGVNRRGGDGDSGNAESTAPATAHRPANTSMSGDGLSVLLATTVAFARVHTSITEAMKEIHTAVFPIYKKNSSIVTVNENGELDQEGMMEETNARISEIQLVQLCERRSAARYFADERCTAQRH